MLVLAVFVRFVLVAVWLLILGRALWSWVDPRYQSGTGRFLFRTTEPIMAPVRRFVPRIGVIDFTPLLIVVVIVVVMRVFGLP